MSPRRIFFNWIRGIARERTPATAPNHRKDRRSAAARDRDTSVIDHIPAELRADIVRGRAILADDSIPASAGEWREQEAITRLLELLWHPDEDARRAAAHALPGGDGHNAHVPHYGHFVGAFGRGLAEQSGETNTLATTQERYACVAATLRNLLAQNISEIRGMSSMNYSFLSSALYLAVLATCRDTLLAIKRLRVAEAQAELCGLLWNLSQIGVARRLNNQDLVTLAQLAGEALAALPPEATPDLWHGLTHSSHPRRLAVAPALLHIQDCRATPYLLDALQPHRAQPPNLIIALIECLARLEDARALPLLQALSAHRERTVHAAAQSAFTAIQRAGRKHPSRTLLRATRNADNNDSETMLRPASVNHHNMEPPHELLRPPGSTPVRGARYE